MKDMRQGLYRALSLWQVDKIVIVLVAMFVLPFLIHLIPFRSSVPLGAVWLPIFFAPLVAVMFCRPHVVLIAATFAPTINRLFIGMPESAMASMLTLELIVFTGVLFLIYAKTKRFLAMGVLAYAIAKVVSIAVFQVAPGIINLSLFGEYFVNAIAVALPGLCALFIIQFFCLRLKENKIS